MRFLLVSMATATLSGSSVCSAIKATKVVNPARQRRSGAWRPSPHRVDEGDVMVGFSPVDPARDSHAALSFLLSDEPESLRSDLMDSPRLVRSVGSWAGREPSS